MPMWVSSTPSPLPQKRKEKKKKNPQKKSTESSNIWSKEKTLLKKASECFPHKHHGLNSMPLDL